MALARTGSDIINKVAVINTERKFFIIIIEKEKVLERFF